MQVRNKTKRKIHFSLTNYYCLTETKYVCTFALKAKVDCRLKRFYSACFFNIKIGSGSAIPKSHPKRNVSRLSLTLILDTQNQFFLSLVASAAIGKLVKHTNCTRKIIAKLTETKNRLWTRERLCLTLKRS